MESLHGFKACILLGITLSIYIFYAHEELFIWLGGWPCFLIVFEDQFLTGLTPIEETLKLHLKISDTRPVVTYVVINHQCIMDLNLYVYI